MSGVSVADALVAARLGALRARGRSRAPATAKPGFEPWVRSRFPHLTWDALQHRAIFEALERVEAGELNKVMFFMPPRHSKSSTITIRYGAYKTIFDHRRVNEVLVAAYNQALARTFTRQIRTICADEGLVSLDQRAADEFATTTGVIVRGAGVQSGITGKGGDVVLIDDPVKNREEADSPTYRERVWGWYNDDLLTRLGPDPVLILTMTRWHLDDLAGRILASEDGPNWHVVHLPAIAMENDPAGREPGDALWPERFPIERLRHIEATNPRGFWALYQGQPQAAEGSVFQSEWWDGRNRFDPEGPLDDCVARIMFWDTAEEESAGSAYTVAVVAELTSEYRMRIVDVVRERVELPGLLRLMIATAERHNHDGKLRVVDVEYASSGRAAYQSLRAQAPEWLQRLLRRTTPRYSKVARAQAAANWCAAGMVELPEPGPTVPWLNDYERELLDFPTGAYADQVDATSGVINRLKRELEVGFRRRPRRETGE